MVAVSNAQNACGMVGMAYCNASLIQEFDW